MGVLVDLFEEIRQRLQTAITSGSLTEVNSLVILPKVSFYKKNDFPIINIWPLSTAEVPNCMHQGFVSVLNINIQIVHNLLADDNNKLYKTSDQTGMLFLYEKVLNVLDKNTSGAIDLTFSGKANNLREYSLDVVESEGIVIFSSVIIVESKLYRAGNR